MADSFIITDGTTSFEVLYDSVTQPNYKLFYGSSVSAVEPSVLLHSPDDRSPLPIRAWDQNRIVFLTMDVLGDDWDDIFNEIHEIKRMVAGAHSQAIKYWLNEKNENRVVLRVQLDGATNYTDIPVLWGFVDDSGGYYTAPASLNKRARGVVIALTVSPHGEDALITGKNELPNAGPHVFSAGLADGWSKVASLTAAEDTTALILSSSQKTTSTAPGDWIRTATITNGGSDTNASAFVWVYSDGAFTYDFDLVASGASGTIATKTLTYSTPTAASKSATDTAGNTWYRMELSGTMLTSENIYLEITHNNSTGNLWIQGAYIELDTAAITLPDFWCSTDKIENRADIDTATDRVNWIDVWGVPGDAPALMRIEAETGEGMSSGYGKVYVSRWRDTMYKAGDFSAFGHWVEDDQLSSLGGAGTYTNPSGTGTTDDSYVQYVDSASASETGGWRYTVADADVGNFFQWPRRVYLRAYSSDAATTFALKSSNTVPQLTETRTVTTINTWELIDIGLINGVGIDNTDFSATTNINIDVEFVTSGDSTDTVRIDAIVFAPAAPDGFMITDGTLGAKYVIFPFVERVSYESRIYPDTLGGAWTCDPGPKLTRTAFVFVDDSDVWDIDDADPPAGTEIVLKEVSVQIKARAYHLLGTQ